MGATTIPWCHYTFNSWWGCEHHSPGCYNCYAEAFARRKGVAWGPNAPRVTPSFRNEDTYWEEPLKWNRKAEKAKERQRVFYGSMMDWADPKGIPELRARTFELTKATPWLDWLFLTKCADHVMGFLPPDWGDGYPNVWMGITTENQTQLDRRLPVILKVPAVVHFLSVEPMLGPVDISRAPWTVSGYLEPPQHDILNWVIVGGESTSAARPMSVGWARGLRDQCQSLGIPFFFKQMGGHPDKREALESIPEDLRIREFPSPIQVTVK